MKYKLLVNSNNLAIVKEFFGYTGHYFDCLSTTDVMKDLTTHFEVFKPDVFLCFVESVYDGTLERIQKLRTGGGMGSALFVIVAKKETCAELENTFFGGLPDLILMRPITPDNIVLRMVNYLEIDRKRTMPARTNRKKHILVVDDDRNMLKLLKNALEDKYEVTTTLNGLLIDKVLASKNVDLIILDYEMPIMTGADIYRKLKFNNEYSKIPVCFLTGVSERSKVEEIMALKPDGYLLKPIDMDMLQAAISNLL